MFRPQIQKTRTLFLIACISMLSVYIVSKSESSIAKDGLKDKKEATRIMQKYIKSLKNIDGYIVSDKDIYNTGLIGVESSSITTIFNESNKNFLDSKLACTHPNFSALMVHLFKEAELNSGDTVAVSMTGSLPGANLALLAACEALKIHPIILSSVGSSSWGANREDMTWLDIETNLYDKKMIDYQRHCYLHPEEIKY